VSKDLEEQDKAFFDRARRNPLRVIDFEYAPNWNAPISLAPFVDEDPPEVEATLP